MFGSEQMRCRTMIVILTYLFALTHKETECLFIGALKAGIIKSEDVGRDDDDHGTRQHDHHTLW